MQIKSFISIFAIMVSGSIFGQEEIFISYQEQVNDSIQINHIENLVDAMQLDKTFQKMSIDSITFPGKFSNKIEFYRVDVYHKKNEIIRISLSPSFPDFAFQYSVGPSSIEYYLDNNQLIFVDEKYNDNSSTGLCGTIGMQNQFYYIRDVLIGTRTNGSCYEPHINLEWLYANFEKAYKISKDRMN